MAKTTFSGPILAGTIKNTTGTTVGTDMKNTGQVVMAQTFAIDLSSGAIAAQASDVIIPANSQIIDVILNVTTVNNDSGAATVSVGTAADPNAFLDAGNLFVNVDTTRTYEQHFIGTGSAGSPQYPNWNSYGADAKYGLPSATSGFFQEILDYGTTLAGTKIVQTLTGMHEAGSTSITPQISISTDNTSYTDYPGSATTDSSNTHSAFGTSFRYVKFRYEFTSTGNDDLLQISALNMRLDTKQITDSGNGTASASDSGGTSVNFNLSFVYV